MLFKAVQPEPDFAKQRREKLDARKTKKSQWKDRKIMQWLTAMMDLSYKLF